MSVEKSFTKKNLDYYLKELANEIIQRALSKRNNDRDAR